ncbi:EAL domain-containing protein [Sulfurimonas sp.]|uniref:EAL domain-containing protein n=1 Tax=Sulfurimonas sp. TaxID=2022749 RepID=UPI002AAFD6AE|nr:EAL domain-containing protein [Sulfurimonas sp.]
MKNSSFNFKIFVLFLIPLISLLYLLSSSISIRYNNLDNSTLYKISANATNIFANLLNNLQIERGLSSAYLGTLHDKNRLLEQYKQTDKSLEKFIRFVNLKSKDKKLLENAIGDKKKPIVTNIIKYISELENIRKILLNRSISFDKQLNYYNKINAKIIQAIEILTMVINKHSNDNNALYEIQLLKENAGIERAIIYNQLLSNSYNYISKIIYLQKRQQYEEEEFMLNASMNSIVLYNSLLKEKNKKTITILRESFLNKSLKIDKASSWFNISTLRINILEDISTKIVDRYISNADKQHSNELFTFYTTILLWVLSLTSLIILALILMKKIKKESENVAELKISAHTFNSHQAIAITDENGIILKINDAFSKITGYSPNEIIGKNTSILKSMKHKSEFYNNMWIELKNDGNWHGDIYNKKKNGEIYLERLSITAIKNDDDITTHYLAQFINITDIKEAQEEAQHQADHDFLTGLINRKFLMQRLNEEFVKAIRHDFLHAFLFIDLDGFKAINDTYGHDIGDKLLIEVSKRLKSVLREEDIVSRMSGDEFAIVVLNIDKAEEEAAKNVKEICKKVIKQLNKIFILDEQKINISASIGVKLFPDGKRGVPQIVANADTAMYQAKDQGKNQFVFFNKTIEFELKRLQLLEEELLFAYNNHEFKFYFQAKVDTKTSEITGAEALIRWLHPKRGLLYPDSFLKVLIDINMLHDISMLALSSACNFIKRNTKTFDGVISINISSNELFNPLFEQDIVSIVESFGVSPTKIEFEITEDELIKNFSVAIIKIKSLRELGFKFAIDDFGIGYSSISYLKQLPVNSLKIDKSFLGNLDNNSNKEVVKMLINMAKTFNMHSVVEGVEDEEQLSFIQDSGAQQYQGYHFSKAIDEDSFQSLVEKTTATLN